LAQGASALVCSQVTPSALRQFDFGGESIANFSADMAAGSSTRTIRVGWFRVASHLHADRTRDRRSVGRRLTAGRPLFKMAVRGPESTYPEHPGGLGNRMPAASGQLGFRLSLGYQQGADDCID
jgi:hypothetical protein